MEPKKEIITYLSTNLDQPSWQRLGAFSEIITHGWGKISFTVKKGQIVGYKIEKTG